MAATVSDRAAVLRREHNDRAWLAWHIAALPKAKRLPSLQSLLAPPERKLQATTWQQQHAVMQQWVAVTNRARKPAE